MAGSDLDKTALDSSLVVAALLAWHEHHGVASAELTDALTRGGVVLPARVLLESFSVMTRLPAPFRLAPADARRLLSGSLARAEIVDLPARESWALLDELAARDIAGGSVYDAHIAAAALSAGARRILTLNRHHFDRVAPPELAVVSPF